MNEPTTITEQKRAELIAFLDGELDEAAAEEVQRTIAVDPQLQREAELLKRTWALLDELPQPRISDEFTTRTLSTIRLAQVAESSATPLWRRRARRGLAVAGWTAGLVVVAALAFLAAKQWIPQESDLLVEDLPVIENLDAYSEVQDIEYLKKLEESGLFDEDDSLRP